MREIFKSGSVGGAPGNRCFYLEVDIPGTATSVAVSGSYAYVTEQTSGLQIVDISNPFSAYIVNAIETSGLALDVAVSGSYAYVADYSDGLQIIDISNPVSAYIAKTVDTAWSSNGVAVSGSYAYVADGDSGLQIVDISNPILAYIYNSVDTPGDAYKVDVSGSYAYVADGYYDGLQVIQLCEDSGDQCTDNDSDGYYAESGCGTAVDCNDNDATIYPGAPEICNDSKDNDCDLAIDCADLDCSSDPVCQTCTDNDSDGYYAESGCGTAVDCNDNDATIYPGAPEICNDSKDNDCDLAIDCADPDCSSDPVCQVEPLLTRITTSSRDEDEPAWSPDGTKLVYTASDDINDVDRNEWIWIINSNGGTPSKVSIDNAGSDEFCREPFWGPSGYIVFEAAWGTSTIYKVPSQGGNAITLAGPGDDNGNIDHAVAPVWDWSGSDRIAFIGSRLDDTDNIYIINSDGTALTKLTDYTTSDRRIYDVAFSPNGTELTYSRYNGERWDIWLLNIGSGTTTQLTENSGNNAMSSWSPDGTQIVFMSDRNGDWDLYIMTASGGDVRRITTNSASDGVPAWSPDGTRIAFTSDRAGTFDIWVISDF